MNSSNGKVQAVTDGTTETRKREHPVSVLRRKEGRGLIEMACDAVHAVSQLTYEMHHVMYSEPGTVPVADLRVMQENALACMQSADHYLRMLDDVLDSAVPPDWEHPVYEPATDW